MQNNKLVGVAAIIIALSLAYYYVLYLPQRDEVTRALQVATTLQQNSEKCSQAKEVALVKYRQQIVSMGSKLSGMESSTSHYNTRLSKCIVEITDLLPSVGLDIPASFVTIQDATEGRDLVACPYIVIGKKEKTFCYTMDVSGKSSDISESQFSALEKSYLTD